MRPPLALIFTNNGQKDPLLGMPVFPPYLLSRDTYRYCFAGSFVGALFAIVSLLAILPTTTRSFGTEIRGIEGKV